MEEERGRGRRRRRGDEEVEKLKEDEEEPTPKNISSNEAIPEALKTMNKLKYIMISNMLLF